LPTPAAEQREGRVIALVIKDLIESGRAVMLLDRPDRNRDRSDGLTVDAELEVDGERWAMEVTTSSGESLGHKLRGQFSRARALGYCTCLVVDQTGAPDLRMLAAVEQVEADAQASLDAIVLIREHDDVHWIRR
jgi:hypothetical protein